MRYLQYLLSIDYFALPGEPRVDKSGWIASITCLSGCLNGSVGPYGVSVNDENFFLNSDRKKYLETCTADISRDFIKYFASAQNMIEPAGTQEIEPENVIKVFK